MKVFHPKGWPVGVSKSLVYYRHVSRVVTVAEMEAMPSANGIDLHFPRLI